VTALVTAYTHVHVGELVLGGMEPREAFGRSCRIYFNFLMPLAYLADGGSRAKLFSLFNPMSRSPSDMAEWGRRAVWPLSEDLQGTDELFFEEIPAPRKWTHTCFTRAAADNAALLARYDDDADRLAVFCPPEDADRLAWMLEMMRRFATGAGTLPECARGAVDQAAGRPRRRRGPADPEWLAAEIAGALDGAWGLLAAVISHYPERRVQMDWG
jgi:hypothetical protein